MKKHRILIADDDRNVRSALNRRLSAWGYTVVESSDGLGVVRECQRKRVDAMILDYEMPNGDGQAIARMLRNECDIPIIFLSGHRKEEFWPQVCALGDVHFMAKPLDDRELRDLLEQIIAAPAR